MTPSPTKLEYANPALRREIGLFGAVMLGLGSILGTGVFVSLAHATELAGPWVLLAIVLAGLLAYCNAMSSAQLAAAYPVSGGTYEYGYRVLNPALGFTAGWMFLLAKSASAATAALALRDVFARSSQIALTSATASSSSELASRFESHIYSLRDLPVIAVGIVAVMSCLILLGVRRTNIVNGLLVFFTVTGLVCFVFVVIRALWSFIAPSRSVWSITFPMINPWNVLNATAITFVAFTGYGRLATLGEEVKEPQRTIPRAILITLLSSLIAYLLVAYALHAVLFQFGAFSAGLVFKNITEAAHYICHFESDGTAFYTLISLAAVTAMLGVLLNLILGLSRVWLAMGRRGDMPRLLARVNEKTSTPVPATILSGVVIALLVLVGDVRTTWSFSAFTVLIYYAITNLACLRLAPEHRRYPRFLAWVGLFACLSLAWFVDAKIWITGTVLILIGLVWHRLRRSARTRACHPEGA